MQEFHLLIFHETASVNCAVIGFNMPELINICDFEVGFGLIFVAKI